MVWRSDTKPQPTRIEHPSQRLGDVLALDVSAFRLRRVLEVSQHVVHPHRWTVFDLGLRLCLRRCLHGRDLRLRGLRLRQPHRRLPSYRRLRPRDGGLLCARLGGHRRPTFGGQRSPPRRRSHRVGLLQARRILPTRRPDFGFGVRTTGPPGKARARADHAHALPQPLRNASPAWPPVGPCLRPVLRRLQHALDVLSARHSRLLLRGFTPPRAWTVVGRRAAATARGRAGQGAPLRRRTNAGCAWSRARTSRGAACARCTRPARP